MKRARQRIHSQLSPVGANSFGPGPAVTIEVTSSNLRAAGLAP